MKLHLLRLGTVPEIPGPIPSHLIRLDDGTNILVDTGVDPDLPAPGPPGSPSPFLVEESEHVVAQLASLGLSPSDIGYVICTHMHLDHAGNHVAFSDAEFVIQKREYEFAMATSNPGFAASRSRWSLPELNYRQVEGDTELFPGVELIESPGHSPGHQSVLVRLPNTGPVLIAGDAIALTSHLDPDSREITKFDMDGPATRNSTRKLVELAHREGVAFIVANHDGQQWNELRTGTQFYD